MAVKNGTNLHRLIVYAVLYDVKCPEDRCGHQNVFDLLQIGSIRSFGSSNLQGHSTRILD